MLAHARAVLTSANRSHLLTESDRGFCSWLSPHPAHTNFFPLEMWGTIGTEAVLSVGWGNVNVCVKRLLFQILSVLMQIHRVNKHQRIWLRTTRPCRLLQMVWWVDGSSASSHWRSSQLFWLSLHKHTDRYGVERCRICFFIMYQLAIFAACREIGEMSSGSRLVVPEQPHPFCSAVVDISKTAAGQCFVWFFWLLLLYWGLG